MAYGEVLWYTQHDGWSMVEDDTLANILSNTKETPYGVSGVTGGLITPKWVVDALDTYNENGGFAGMSPAEYLDRVSNGKTVGPKHTF